jgi:DNA modification methylase
MIEGKMAKKVKLNTVANEDAVTFMAKMEESSIDLTVTSPPYDDLRSYQGYNFDFEGIANGLYKITKKGGVVVWVVGDKVIKGNRTLTSFRQALYFQSIGFNVHDVMIYKKKNTPFMRSNAYTNCYEFMFVFTKGAPNTYNPIKEATVRQGYEKMPANKKADGINNKVLSKLNPLKSRTNIWEYAVGMGGTTSDKIAFKHPAVYPEKLAEDHIISWTKIGDTVFDPMSGSGTTLKMAYKNGRNYIGCDISSEYVEIAKERLKLTQQILPE